MDALQELLAIERIRQVKYKYFRTLDLNEWDELATCLTEDCVARYDSGKYSYNGRAAILEFLDKFMTGPKMLTLHQGHHPEIRLQSDTEATGTWYLEDMVINLHDNTTLRGNGFYEDCYRLEDDGEWRIYYTGYERTFEEIEQRDDSRLEIHRNLFAAREAPAAQS